MDGAVPAKFSTVARDSKWSRDVNMEQERGGWNFAKARGREYACIEFC